MKTSIGRVLYQRRMKLEGTPWTVRYNPARGRYVYINQETGERRWRMPNVYKYQQDEEDFFVDDDIDYSNGSESQWEKPIDKKSEMKEEQFPAVSTSQAHSPSKTNLQPASLPSNLEIFMDDNGRIYFQYDNSKIRMPGYPGFSDLNAEQHKEILEVVLKKFALPDDWEIRWDYGKGQIYFVDHNSKTTTWYHPSKTTQSYKNGYSASGTLHPESFCFRNSSMVQTTFSSVSSEEYSYNAMHDEEGNLFGHKKREKNGKWTFQSSRDNTTKTDLIAIMENNYEFCFEDKGKMKIYNAKTGEATEIPVSNVKKSGAKNEESLFSWYWKLMKGKEYIDSWQTRKKNKGKNK
jgi:hypothetical protein